MNLKNTKYSNLAKKEKYIQKNLHFLIFLITYVPNFIRLIIGIYTVFSLICLACKDRLHLLYTWMVDFRCHDFFIKVEWVEIIIFLFFYYCTMFIGTTLPQSIKTDMTGDITVLSITATTKCNIDGIITVKVTCNVTPFAYFIFQIYD